MRFKFQGSYIPQNGLCSVVYSALRHCLICQYRRLHGTQMSLRKTGRIHAENRISRQRVHPNGRPNWALSFIRVVLANGGLAASLWTFLQSVSHTHVSSKPTQNRHVTRTIYRLATFFAACPVAWSGPRARQVTRRDGLKVANGRRFVKDSHDIITFYHHGHQCSSVSVATRAINGEAAHFPAG